MFRSRLVGCWVGLLLLGSCAEPLSDTGFEGTWSRSGDQVVSALQVVRRGQEWQVLWTLSSREGGRREVRCDWGAPCEEYVDDVLSATYEISAHLEAASGNLVLEWDIEVLRPERLRRRQVDEWVLDDGGLALWAYTRERDGQTFAGDARPKRRLEKSSDRVRPVGR